MSRKKLFHRVTTLFIPICLALLPAAAFAAKDDPPKVPPKIQFFCEQKAAAFTRMMGKPGNMDLYMQHLKECIEVTTNQTPTPDPTPTPPTPPPPPPPPTDDPCTKAGGHPFTFKNMSGETVWLGVWDAANSVGVAPPDDWPNWEMAPNAQKTWCAPIHFLGRFITRTRCETKTIPDPQDPKKTITVLTGICAEGNCTNAPTDAQLANPDFRKNVMNCTIGPEPSSLLEFNFDDNTTGKPAGVTGVTWYDVSYVDGYNFPIMVVSNDATKCKTLGESGNNPNEIVKMPDCPWPTTNGVCLGPYKQYALTHPWHVYEQDYYTMAAMCADWGKDICGCGDQCWDKTHTNRVKATCPDTYTTPTHPLLNKQITLKSSGCSPFNPNYLGEAPPPPRDERALAQVVCDPLGKTGRYPCQNNWPEEYKAYVKNIVAVVHSAYTWQYHDDTSLTSCDTVADQSFTVTIGPRTKASKGNAYAVGFNSDPASKGSITVGRGTPSDFAGGVRQEHPLQPGDKVTIVNNCPASTRKVSCTATYDASKGLVSDDKADGALCNTSLDSGITWGDSRNVQIAAPSPAGCGKFSIYQADKFHAKISVNGKQLADIEGTTDPKNPKPPYVVDLAGRDNVKLVVDCMNCPSGGTCAYPAHRKTVTCNATFNGATGALELDGDGGSCQGAAPGLTFPKGADSKYRSVPYALHPGVPSDTVCQ